MLFTLLRFERTSSDDNSKQQSRGEGIKVYSFVDLTIFRCSLIFCFFLTDPPTHFYKREGDGKRHILCHMCYYLAKMEIKLYSRFLPQLIERKNRLAIDSVAQIIVISTKSQTNLFSLRFFNSCDFIPIIQQAN